MSKISVACIVLNDKKEIFIAKRTHRKGIVQHVMKKIL